MDEELILRVIQQVLADPRLQTLMDEPPLSGAGHPWQGAVVRPDLLVLLNYIPNPQELLQEIMNCWKDSYSLKVLASDAVMRCKPDLPAGMTWVTCQEALGRSWELMVLPACSANTLAKIALGIRDTAICVMAAEGLSRGILVELYTNYLGFTDKTPAPYRRLYEDYLSQVASYGVIVRQSLKDQTVVCGATSTTCQSPISGVKPSVPGPTQAIGWSSRLLTEKDVLAFPSGSIICVGKGAIVTPLAKDMLKRRQVEIRREGDGKL